MVSFDQARERLASIPLLQITRNEPLARHTRFGLGGPAALYAETADEAAFLAAVRVARTSGLSWVVIGEGTNLLVSDAGYRGIVLRYRGAAIEVEGERVTAQAGALLQDVVNATLLNGLKGLHSMTGIPGNIGAAVYGNAGAYGSSISDFVERVRFFDGEQVREADNAGCGFRYRGSAFKRSRLSGAARLILSVDLRLPRGDAEELRKSADEILSMRNRKYPPDMRCAGSIFKNLILAELPKQVRSVVPATVVKGGKVPSAWFLDQVQAKGIRVGGIEVATYHANLVYNSGSGTAAQARELIGELKRRVRDRFHLELEEEVQYMGFAEHLPGVNHLVTTPHILQGLVVGLTKEEFQWKPSDARWSISEVLAHLAHVERKCYQPRVEAILMTDDPVLEPYDPSLYNSQGVYRTRFALASLEDFLKSRRESLALLDGVPQAALSRTARHKEMGPITLEHILNEWAFHDLGHIRQIAELVRAVKYHPSMGTFSTHYNVNP